MLREVKVSEGIVRGLPAADPRITVYKGIPFAKPPVGNLRWAPPQPAQKWEGVRNCFEFSAVPVQPGALENPPDDDLYGKEWCVDTDQKISEDCLYLNVWTPARKADEKLPVYFWIFGGGWQVGNTTEMEFDGERIARRGIVVVSVNYRVNLFGFTSHKEITAEWPDTPANFGIQDQQFALKWVYENIEAFGGNKENITIGGQSAGGGSVLIHVQNPESRKYFKRAVVESGVFCNPFRGMFPRHSIADAEKIGQEFFEFCGVKNLEEARNLSTETLRQKWSDWGGFSNSAMTWCPIHDGKFMPGDIIEQVQNGKVDLPPLLLGYTTGEFVDGPDGSPDSEKVNTVELGIRKLLKADSENGGTAAKYVYKFGPKIPGWDNQSAFHSVDLWFFFETLAKCWRNFEGYHYDLARNMCDYLCNFIWTGDPNDDGTNGTHMRSAGVNYLPTKEENIKRFYESYRPLAKWNKFDVKQPECMEFIDSPKSIAFEPSDAMKKYL